MSEKDLIDALECIVGLEDMQAEEWDARWPEHFERLEFLRKLHGPPQALDIFIYEIAKAALSK